jgi:hypothetical protein
MENFLNPDKADLIRETILVLFGIVLRWIELRKLKKNTDDKL